MVLNEFSQVGVEIDALAGQMQAEGAESFVKSWKELMEVIESKGALLQKSG